MKNFGFLVLLLPLSVAAQSPLLAPKGARATLTVEYQYTAIGNWVAPAKDSNHDWNVRRTVNITARMSANAPQPISAMRQDKESQKALTKDVEARVASAQAKAQPTMQDMMKIADRCGDDEACITRAVSEYGMNMSAWQQADLNSARESMTGLVGAGAMRYQMWTLESQRGTYALDEVYHKQVLEMTCTVKNPCKREEIRKGSGDLTVPPGTEAGAGFSMLEVDSSGKDMVVALPVPIMPVGYTKTLATNIPDDEKGGVTKGLAPNWLAPAAKQFIVKIAGGLNSAAGTQTFKLTGEEGEGGTVIAKWKFTRDP
jgi:hypothetical protein